MNHPCLVTLERDSAPRVLFSGDRLVEVDLPPGTRCIYPKPPAEGRVIRGENGMDVGDRVNVELVRVDRDKGFIDFAR